MSHRYSTALSHLVLAGTGVYCLSAYGAREFRFPVVSYGLIIANSVIGVWRYGNPDYGQNVDKPYRVTAFLEKIFAVPCIAAQVWLQSGYNPPEIACLHAGIPALPLAMYLARKERKDVVELVIAANLASMCVVSLVEARYYGVAAVASFVLNYFVIRDEGTVADSLPALDLFNYGMCFAAYFALRGLRGE